MRSVGIICECNPFHGGHEYLIRRARESGADAVIALMSGCFVQRGEAAIADPYLRAKALLCGGADAVLELPFPYAAAGAEFFAHAGVDILSRLGVEELWFGSEFGEIQTLARLAILADSDVFRDRYAQASACSCGTAQAFFDVLREMDGGEVHCSPNDILGISYLRAIAACGARILPVTIKREGSAYLDDTLHENAFPSATALRRKWREEGVESVLPFLPESSRALYADVREFADLDQVTRLILGHFRLTSAEKLERVAELSGGLGNRLAEAACKANDLKELFSLAATKKYPHARLHRGVLFALTGIMSEDLHTGPAYVRLLAANSAGCRFLSACRKNADIPVVTRRTDLPITSDAARQEMWERRAYALYDLCFATVGTIPSPWQRMPFITG